MNNVLDYGLDRVTNPNEVKVNQVCLMHSRQGLDKVPSLGRCVHTSICVRGAMSSLLGDCCWHQVLIYGFVASGLWGGEKSGPLQGS